MPETVESFDLREVQGKRRRLMKAPRAICAVGAAVFLLIDARLVELIALGASSPFRLAELAVTLTFGGFLLWAALLLFSPDPVRLDLTSEGMFFGFDSGRFVSRLWSDDHLDVSIVDFTTVPWDNSGIPMYLMGIAPWRSFALTTDAGTAVLREARSHGLALSPGGTAISLFNREYGKNQTHIRGKGVLPKAHSPTQGST